MPNYDELLEKLNQKATDRDQRRPQEQPCPLKNPPVLVVMVAQEDTFDPLDDISVHVKPEAQNQKTSGGGLATFDPLRVGDHFISTQLTEPQKAKYISPFTQVTFLSAGKTRTEMVLLPLTARVEVSVKRNSNQKTEPFEKVAVKMGFDEEQSTPKNGLVEFKGLRAERRYVTITLPEGREELQKILIDGQAYTGFEQGARQLTVPVMLKAGGVTKVQVDVGLPPLLEVVEVDHHFVPGAGPSEQLRIHYRSEGCTDSQVFLRVVSDEHEPPVIFERALTSSETADGTGKMLEWDGRANCASGPLAGKLVNPLLGPMKVRLAIPDVNFQTKDTDKTATRVLIHSLKLAPGSYIEDPRRRPTKVTPIPTLGDANWADHVKWVQYQLNSLGYLAGPVDGTLSDQTKRAIKRYTHEMINTQEHDRADDPAFVRSLGTFDLRLSLMSDWNVIGDRTKSSNVFIQHNYFYHTEGGSGSTNFNLADGHWHKESNYADPRGGKLDRFEVPIEAAITLESRGQQVYDAKHPGVTSPQAVGEVEVEWISIDPPEDTSVLPKYIGVTSPCSAQDYINAVRAKVTGVANPTAATGADNCPADCGGFDKDFFAQLLPTFPVRAGTSDDKAVSKVHQDSSRHREGLGKTAVLFRGSHIGGDNYIVKAAISFAGKPNKDVLEREHVGIQKAAAFDQILCAQTGTMTTWRKRRVSAVVNWSEEALPVVDWSEVVLAFKAAFMELDVENVETQRIDHYVTTPEDKTWYLDRFKELNATFDRAALVFTHKHMFAFPFEQGKKEKLADYQNRITLQTYGFPSTLTRLTMGSDTTKGIGDWLAPIIKRTRRPGYIVLRAMPFAGITLTKTSGFFKKETKVAVKDVGRSIGTNATGVGGGVAFITAKFWDWKDGYITAHEIAHCSYLSHPFQVAVDHDMGDINCTMYYLHGTNPPKGRPMPLDLNRGSRYVPKFCGKCLLKLRGWKVADSAFTFTPDSSPQRPPPKPVNARMVSEGYAILDGSYLVEGNEVVNCAMGATDPKDPGGPTIPLGPLKFVHPHRLTWESSDDNLESLAKLETREEVKYRRPTQDPPFSPAADPDQWFVQNGEAGSSGYGLDLHSVTWPPLICRYPLVEGELIGEQKYQYKPEGGKWTDIPEAAFLIRKIVYKNKQTGEWVFKFVKENWEEHNPNEFYFEVQYKIWPKPYRLPYTSPNPNVDATKEKWKLQSSPLAAIFASGPKIAGFSTKSETKRVVTLDELRELGLLASEPWL